MRSLPMLPILVASSLARAGSPYTPLVDVSTVEGGCRPLAVVPQSIAVTGPSLDAAISTANCVAMIRTRALVLTPTADSVRALDEAVAPAIAILDRVVAAGDPEHALIAEFAKVDILQGNTARMLAALPRLSPQMSRSEVAEHMRLVAATDVLTERWRKQAFECRRKIARLAFRYPDLAEHDAVLAYMIASTRIVDAVGLAAR